MKIKAGIIGGAGYTGGELIRLLIRHPYVSIAFIHSRSQAGKQVASIHEDLAGDCDLVFTGNLDATDAIDVLFLCVGHGEGKKFLQENRLPSKLKIIDLSQDFRLGKNATMQDRTFTYGLPELNRDTIRTADNIANPGCFATAIQLALLPLAKEHLLNDVHVTGITGSTGAGQNLSATSHFSWRANNIQPYKTLSHQHREEISQSLSIFGENGSIHFIPWRGDFTRGIFTSSVIDCDKEINKVLELYQDFYKDHSFTYISEEPISLKQVVNTNKCLISLEKVDAKLVVHSAIDNLLKGASGQAVQNMNLMFGIEEESGLQLKATGF